MTWPLRQAFRLHFLRKVALIDVKVVTIPKLGISMVAKNLPRRYCMKFMMLYLMPLMMLMWMNNYASGLCYYYFVSQIITIIINYAFRYGVNEQKLRDKMLALASVKGTAKKSKWQMRLEEARKQQEQMAKERERRQYRSKR
jgi:YidC/Oxa1 family membrane protein insertase